MCIDVKKLLLSAPPIEIFTSLSLIGLWSMNIKSLISLPKLELNGKGVHVPQLIPFGTRLGSTQYLSAFDLDIPNDPGKISLGLMFVPNSGVITPTKG